MVLDGLSGLYGLKYDSATACGLPLYLCSYKLVSSTTTVGYNCYHGNNHVLMNKRRPGRIVIEKQQGMEVLVPIYSHLCRLRTDSLYVLMSF